MFDPYPKELEGCQLCPRLVEHREAIAKRERMLRRSYQNETYWGKPVPGFGDPKAKILILGLAPGAHGSNRTGRMFTGDASGDFLYPALHRAGLASQAESKGLHDGMQLTNVWITAACRCVPPKNKPSSDELRSCQGWLKYDFAHLTELKLILALGSVGHNAYLEYLKAKGRKLVKKQFAFGHAKLHEFAADTPMLDSYHVSFQNTNTGKLTASMFDSILSRAVHIVVAS